MLSEIINTLDEKKIADIVDSLEYANCRASICLPADIFNLYQICFFIYPENEEAIIGMTTDLKEAVGSSLDVESEQIFFVFEDDFSDSTSDQEKKGKWLESSIKVSQENISQIKDLLIQQQRQINEYEERKQVLKSVSSIRDKSEGQSKEAISSISKTREAFFNEKSTQPLLSDIMERLRLYRNSDGDNAYFQLCSQLYDNLEQQLENHQKKENSYCTIL